MNRRRRLFAIVAATMAAACRAAPSPPPAQKAASPSDPAAATVPHGDHNPHHGGVVMMKGDLHYEVVLDPSGRDYRLYFSDAVREELPAAYASSVALTIRRPGDADEPIVMKI